MHFRPYIKLKSKVAIFIYAKLPSQAFRVRCEKTFENNAKLALTLKMIPALSFVPPSDVESVFTLDIDKMCQAADQFDIPTEILEKIDKLASYFQQTDIKGETTGPQQRDPLLLPALRNHYGNAAAGLIRTTNAVDGWHNGFPGQPSLISYVFRNHSA